MPKTIEARIKLKIYPKLNRTDIEQNRAFCSISFALEATAMGAALLVQQHPQGCRLPLEVQDNEDSNAFPPLLPNAPDGVHIRTMFVEHLQCLQH